MTVTLQDVCWLREAALKRGTQAIPAAIARKLIASHLITRDALDVMRITARGQIALTRLG